MAYAWDVHGMCMACARHMHGGHQLVELHGVPRGGGGGGGVGGVGTSEAAEALRAWLRGSGSSAHLGPRAAATPPGAPPAYRRCGSYAPTAAAARRPAWLGLGSGQGLGSTSGLGLRLGLELGLVANPNPYPNPKGEATRRFSSRKHIRVITR
eukprot:scaffold73875_cov57-Phaeocystis_antarctica.AAC.1